MRQSLFLIAALYVALGSALPAADRPAEKPGAVVPADKTAADLQAMQGRWTREYTNRQGAVFRNEKTIDGNRDTVAELDANGNTIYSHTATFKLTLDGNVRTFTFSNFVVTAGPNLGAQIPGSRSFIYKLDGDTMYEIWGVLDSDRKPPLIYVWKRVTEKP